MRPLALLLLVLMQVCVSSGQTRDSKTQPLARPEDCICNKTDAVCSCRFSVEFHLTMVLEDEKRLVYPDKGILKFRDNNMPLNSTQRQKVITADGAYSRLVIAINGVFPGPRIEVFENQVLNLTVVNALSTDSITIHFHGLHQKKSPWMDGVAFVTQCPILPGQTFVYRFTAYPPGTNFYHAHIGDQRSMGLYGPLIVRPQTDKFQNEEIVVTLQDWNHLMDADTAYHRMLTQQFDFQTGKVIDTTYSIDSGQFSRFEFQSGLINGKGRFWDTVSSTNGAPLERFSVEPDTIYRIRVIGAMTLYPMRVYIRGQRISLRSSDAYNIEELGNVQSVIVHPGERYDIWWSTPSEPTMKEYFLIAKTIETAESLNKAFQNDKYHVAEAIFEMNTHPGDITDNPVNDKSETCTELAPCVTFNCPYTHYPKKQNRICKNFNDVFNQDPARDHLPVLGSRVDEEYFFNFAFPGPAGSPGSVNGRGFVPPTGSLLTQSSAGVTQCDDAECLKNGICDCTYIQNIGANKLIQMVFLNLGTGSGWSHPIHLHGHSFYFMKMGLGTYNQDTGAIEQNTQDIKCTDTRGYCSTAAWTNENWADGRVPGLNKIPPEKDTVVVPTGGYVVVRFISDNPGRWFLHCHIDLHNTNGMGMVIAEAGSIPAAPPGFPVCNNFWYSGLAKQPEGLKDQCSCLTTAAITGAVCFAGFVLIAVIHWNCNCRKLLTIRRPSAYNDISITEYVRRNSDNGSSRRTRTVNEEEGNSDSILRIRLQ